VRALLLTALLAALPAAAAAATPDDDFEPARARSLALGPLPPGSPLLSADIGWLKSGLRLDLGLFGSLDLVLRVETMLLYDGLGGQNGAHLGLRFTPIAESAFRVGLEFTAGEGLITARAETVTMTVLRGELVLGTMLDLGNVYARLGLRGLDPGVSGLGWTRDEEIGFGVEHALGRWIVGAEGFVWARPRHSGLAQWRIRVGFAP
jgi:hypothetical protein